MSESRCAASAPPQSADAARTRLVPHSYLFVLALILVLGGVLRFFDLSALGFWTDELCTLSCSHGWGLQFDQVPVDTLAPRSPAWPNMTRLSDARPFGDIIPAMARDEAHPPLYFLLLRLWENLLGDSESAVRSLDVIFSLAAIALLFFTAVESIGATPALAACLLMAVATPQIQFSQEARNYMPVVTFSLLAALAVQRLKRRPSTGIAALLSAALLAMMLTHYFAAGVALSLAVYALLTLRGRSLRLCALAFAVAAVLFLALWGRYLLRQIPHFRSNYAWISDNNPGHLARALVNLCKLPVRSVGQWPQSPLLQDASILIGALALVALPVLFMRRPALRMWGLWIAGSIGLILAVDLIRSTAQLGLMRYCLFATPAIYVLIAGAFSRRFRLVLPAAAVLLALTSLGDAYVPAWKADYRTVVQMIDSRKKPQDGLVIIGPDPIADGVMFAAFQHYSPQLPPTTAVLTGPPRGQVLNRLRQCPQVWIVRFGKEQPMPDLDVLDEVQLPYVDLLQGRFRTPATLPRENR